MFHGTKVSSDGELFPYRDLDDAVQLTESGAADLLDNRTDTNIQLHPWVVPFSAWSGVSNARFLRDEGTWRYLRLPRHLGISGLEDEREVTARLSWQTHEANPGQRHVSFEDTAGAATPVHADGEDHICEVDVSAVSDWGGLILKLQLVLAEGRRGRRTTATTAGRIRRWMINPRLDSSRR